MLFLLQNVTHCCDLPPIFPGSPLLGDHFPPSLFPPPLLKKLARVETGSISRQQFATNMSEMCDPSMMPSRRSGFVAQWLEHCTGNCKVMGWIEVESLICFCFNFCHCKKISLKSYPQYTHMHGFSYVHIQFVNIFAPWLSKSLHCLCFIQC